MKSKLFDLIKKHQCKYHMRYDNSALMYRKAVAFGYSIGSA